MAVSSEQRDRALKEQRARNLANQRNLRTRRKQYVEELESKVRAFEEAEVSATKQVQAAARIVATENAVLRELLQSALKWSAKDINDYVSQRIPTGVQPTSSVMDGNDKASNRQSSTMKPLSKQNPRKQNRDEEMVAQCNNHTPGPERRDFGGESRAKSSQTKSLSAQIDYESDIKFNNNDRSFEMETPTSPYMDKNGKNSKVGSMTCEQAASIILELGMQGSVDNVRQSLGCNSSTSCDIPHSQVFQVMEGCI